MKTLKLFLLVFLSWRIASAKDELLTYSDVPIPELGFGYEKDTETFKGACALGTLDLSARKPTGTLTLVSEVQQSQIEKDLGIGMDTSYRSGAINGSASADYSKSTKNSSHSISMTYRGAYDFGVSRLKEIVWDDSAKGLLQPKPGYVLKRKMDKAEAEGKDPWILFEKELFAGMVEPHPDYFEDNCGQTFVVGHKIGALIFVNMRFDFESQAAKEALGVKLKAATATFKFSAELKKEMKSASKRSKATVNVLQVGGRVEKISQIFGRSNGSNDDSGYRNFVNCSFGDFDKCSEVFIKAIQYAADVDSGFPSQINVDPAEPDNAYGPAILGSYVRNYQDQFKMTEMSEQSKKDWLVNRKTISKRFEEAYENWVELDRMLETSIPRIPSELSLEVEDKRTTAKVSMTRAAEALDNCYATPFICKDALAELNAPFEDGGIHIYKKEDLHVPLTSFAQYCDYERAGGRISEWQDSLSQSEMHSIRILNRLAQAEAPSGLDISESDDPCFKTQEILNSMDTMDLSFIRVKKLFTDDGLSDESIAIKNLEVLKSLSNLSNLNLAGHNLEDSHLTPLNDLKSLRKLDLSKNRLVRPQSLQSLTQLIELDLSNNNISDVQYLISLSALRELNLSNNVEETTCPNISGLFCITVNFEAGSDFTFLGVSNGIPRAGQVAVPYQQGVLFIGGFNNDVPVTFVSNNGFQAQTPLQAQMRRTFASATKRSDDSVVLFGGVEATHTLVEMTLGFSPADVAFIRDAKPYKGYDQGRYLHQAALLQDDSVLIMGGYETHSQGIPTRKILASSLIYTADGVLTTGPGMRVPRAEHRAMELEGGFVLVTGGLERYTANGKHKVRALDSAEIYNPNTQQFEALPARMNYPRYGHQMTMLDGGKKILITGGFIPQGFDGQADNSDVHEEDDNSQSGKTIDQQVLPYAEIYDLKTRTFTLLKTPQRSPRANHEAIKLDNGLVLLLGGRTEFVHRDFFSEDVCKSCSKSAEVFDPATNRFFDLGSEMRFPRAYFTATPIEGRRILIRGGTGEAMRSAEIFEYNGLPEKAEWSNLSDFKQL